MPDYLFIGKHDIFAFKPTEIEGNLTNVTLNKTNIYLLFNRTNATFSDGSVRLVRVYANNDTIIYRVFTRT
jgi:uncharacterized protein YukJ